MIHLKCTEDKLLQVFVGCHLKSSYLKLQVLLSPKKKLSYIHFIFYFIKVNCIRLYLIQSLFFV